MKGETWQKIAKGLGIAGGVGAGCAAAATLIKVLKPEAADLSVDQTAKIQAVVMNTMAAAEKAKQKS